MDDLPDHPLATLVEERRAEIKAAVRRHKGRSVALFGSVARGEETRASDLDFLVEFEPGSSLFDLLHLQDELTALLGRRRVVRRAETQRSAHQSRSPQSVTRSDDERIADISEAARQVADLVARGRAEFDRDIAVRFAIERLLEVIGEAANRVK
jgi:predicted nucleotidyltransferase